MQPDVLEPRTKKAQVPKCILVWQGTHRSKAF